MPYCAPPTCNFICVNVVYYRGEFVMLSRRVYTICDYINTLLLWWLLAQTVRGIKSQLFNGFVCYIIRQLFTQIHNLWRVMVKYASQGMILCHAYTNTHINGHTHALSHGHPYACTRAHMHRHVSLSTSMNAYSSETIGICVCMCVYL